ncbi:MAG: helix-turn-helix transcriptional regulator [Oscillospiraceae bacterium]
MDNAELGRRLKAARLAKKMTQSEVTGNFITRNMLSQIESGSATPSMKTLEYLAGVLEIPMEKLLSDSDGTEAENSALSVLNQAKRLFQEEKFQELLKVQFPHEVLQDEFHALYALAHLALAQNFSTSNQIDELQQAVFHANVAIQEAQQGIYANDTIVSQAHNLISSIAKCLSEYYSSLAAGE